MPSVTKDMIDDWGKEAATNYIEHGIPMNTTLVKIASEYALNLDQTARAVESANIAMHTRVNVNNKYPEFEVADLNKVAHSVPKLAQVEPSHYDAPPTTSSFMKTSSAVDYGDDISSEIPPDVAHKAALAVHGADKLYSEKLAELAQDIYDVAYDIKRMVKQAVLDPDQTQSCLALFKVAAHACATEASGKAIAALVGEVDTTIKAACSESMYKKASADPDTTAYGALNTNHPVLVKLASYVDLLGKYQDAASARNSAIQKVAMDFARTAHLNEKQASVLSKTLKYGIPTVAVGATGVAIHKAGQDAALRKISPMTKEQLPEKYKRY